MKYSNEEIDEKRTVCQDLQDILNYVRIMGSLVENKGMKATGQSYTDAVDEAEWILADYDISDGTA